MATMRPIRIAAACLDAEIVAITFPGRRTDHRAPHAGRVHHVLQPRAGGARFRQLGEILRKAIAPTVAADNVTINNMLPERIDTGRQVFMVARMAKLEGITVEEARAKVTQQIAAKRFGRPEEFGDCCAFLCSAQAGFISGQNIQLDGGSMRG